jgi:FecR protein
MRTRILKSADAGGSMRKFLILFTTGVLLSALAVADDDPPSRAARLSYMAGTVSFQPNGEETDWVPADLNRALTTGDKVWVEQGGRTEIQTVNSVVRLNGHTNFSFLGVEGDTTQIQLSLGVITVNLTSLADNETYEIDTPQVAFTLLRPGLYRVEVNEAGDTTVVRVRAGGGETTADGKAAPLNNNEEVVIKGNPASYDKHGVPKPDEFDAWGAERDARAANSVSVRAVAPGVVGAVDLDVAGVWRPAPIYGNVWFPNGMVADWAPYRFGHWGFVAPWGWTWIDDAPWGYAPFHYGRWVNVGGLWGWAPGPIAVTAIYAPALVSFIGGIEVVGVADPVSWVALSWGEPWYPSFGVSFGYYNSVNLCGTIFAAGIIAGVWGGAAVNLSFGHDPRAVNVVGRGGFAGGHPVGREFAHRDHFGGHAFDHAGARRDGARGIAGTREGRLGGHAPLGAGGRGVPPRGAMGRSAVTRHEPGARGGNFRGAGVAARHGASANGGHAGGFKGGAHGAPAAAHGAEHGAPAAHGPAGGAKGGAPASHSPAGGAKGGAPASHGPAAGGAKGGAPASHSPAAGGAKGGAPASHAPAAGAARAGAPAAGRSGAPAAGGARAGAPAAGRSGAPAAGGARAGAPAAGRAGAPAAGRAGAPAGGGARAGAPAGGASHPAAPVHSAPSIPKKK